MGSASHKSQVVKGKDFYSLKWDKEKNNPSLYLEELNASTLIIGYSNYLEVECNKDPLI